MNESTVLVEDIALVKSSGEKAQGVVRKLKLHRPEFANSLNQQMVEELQKQVDSIAQDSNIRVLVLESGRPFCAGADLNWMKQSGENSFAENLSEAQQLAKVFSSIHDLEIPSISLVDGAAYGGGVGLAACCDWTIATTRAKFCLSEVKLGLIPAVILPHLVRRFSHADLFRYGLSGRVFSAREAKEKGFVQVLVEEDRLQETLLDELTNLLASAPMAQKRFKKLFREVTQEGANMDSITAKAIAETRSGDEAKEGLSGFFSKETARWVASLSDL